MVSGGDVPHAMAVTEATPDDGNDAPIVNGHALDSVEGVRKALSYLSNDYNDGDLVDISTLSGDDGVAIKSRHTKFEHLDSLLDAQCGGYINITSIRSQSDQTLRIEVQEA